MKMAQALRERILKIAHDQTRMPISNLNLVDGNIIRKSDGRILKSLGDLAMESLYSLEARQHITAEPLARVKSNAYSFGCSFAETVKEDIDPRDSWRAAKDFRMHIAVESAKRVFLKSIRLAGGEP